jgi:hypothetical protein
VGECSLRDDDTALLDVITKLLVNVSECVMPEHCSLCTDHDGACLARTLLALPDHDGVTKHVSVGGQLAVCGTCHCL